MNLLFCFGTGVRNFGLIHFCECKTEKNHKTARMEYSPEVHYQLVTWFEPGLRNLEYGIEYMYNYLLEKHVPFSLKDVGILRQIRDNSIRSIHTVYKSICNGEPRVHWKRLMEIGIFEDEQDAREDYEQNSDENQLKDADKSVQKWMEIENLLLSRTTNARPPKNHKTDLPLLLKLSEAILEKARKITEAD